MDIAPFALERWFARYEHDADIMLAESGIRSLPAQRFDTDPGDLGYVIPTNGDPDLRADLADRYGRSADEVLCTCGAQEANFLAFLTLMDRDSHAVCVTPTYQALHELPRTVGSVTTVDLDPPAWELDVDAVADAVQSNTTVVVLNNPNNPTGRYHDAETVRALYDLAADADAYLLCDEVYRLLSTEPLPPVASMGPHGLSTASLTKSYGLAGARFGWLVGDTDVVDGAWNWKDYTTISPSLFGQHVARQALDRSEELLRENRALAAKHHDIVAAWVDDHDLSWHDPVGVNGFISVPPGFEDGEAFCRAVVERESVVLAPGNSFGFPGFFRIGFGLPTDELVAGLERVGRVVAAGRE
jgi:aspartate/methionine/tyrosine aminotransferase